jgi:hypothetical protein
VKAAAVRLVQKPPRVITLGPRSFSSRWAGRPTGSIEVGLRIASADEQLRAASEATERTKLLLPSLAHGDPCWAATYEVCWVHYLLGMVMTSPADVNAPLWPAQDGSLLLCEQEPHVPGDPPVTSLRFSDSGIARLLDEYDALCIADSAVWPEAAPAEIQKLGARLADGSFFADLDAAAKGGNHEARHVAAQLRRLIHYVVHIRTHGLERPTPTA